MAWSTVGQKYQSYARGGAKSKHANDSHYQTDAGYDIKWFANSGKYLNFKISDGLKRYIQTSIKSGLVILNGIFHPSVYAMSYLLKKHDVPYIVAPHDPYHPSIFNKNAHLKWTYWYLIERRVLRQAQAIQVLDIAHAKWLRSLGIETPIIEVPNGFIPNETISEVDLEYRQQGSIRLIFLGRIDAYNKGLDILLEAFAQIADDIDAQLTFQGPDEGDRSLLEKKATELKIRKRVSFREPDFHTSAPLLVSQHDIFCLPSRFEGFSLAGLESMLAGRVLLISEVAGIASHVKVSGCGVVVKPSISSVRQGLMHLAQLREHWKEMGLAGRHHVLEHLKWDNLASKALENYHKICFSSKI